MSNSNYGFLALALRQRLIKRWSLMHSVQPESVLEHSATVTLLALLAGHVANQKGNKVDLAKMLSHAALHDVAEVLCQDVVTPVKKANDTLAREFERLEKAAEEQLIHTLPLELQGAVAKAFAPGGYEQQLVKACDTYAAYIKCKLEVAAGNALEFQDALDKMIGVVSQLKSDFPEIEAIDQWFGAGLNLSVDKLLSCSDDEGCYIKFVTDQRPGEPDILAGNEQSDLILTDLEGKELKRIKPTAPWTHETLSMLTISSEWARMGVEAYLGKQWVGSTEV
ncbi:5'-deoxynucleotidase [Vibrio parahaemolyticus]|jgi:5'-deoxynucleotidase|nr:5'-deoxynucleotidase [Vibrio parahaemolyticus]